MPNDGDIPETGAPRPRFRAAVFTLAVWRAALPVRNRHIRDMVAKDAKSELSVARWNNNMADVERGWVNTPVPLSNSVFGPIALTPRYATAESHGGRPAEIRLIGDVRASGVNDAITPGCS